MKPHQLLVTLLAFVTTSGALACGVPEADSDSDSESGSSVTDPVPLTCYHGGQSYEDGAEFETADGCVGYRCDGGVLIVLTDERVTVAGDLDLPSQQDVDAQACLGVVEGSLTISGTAADLTPLAQLSRVGGALDITASDAVTFDGLQSLTEVGAGIVIADNQSLTTMSFYPLMSVFGDVTIQNNDALTSLAGAEFIGQCNTCSVRPRGLDDGQGTTGGSDFDPMGDEGPSPGGTFYGNILVADNDLLANVAAMSNLAFAWESVRFRSNAALTDLSVLTLSEVRGDLEISGHAAMDDAGVQSFANAIDVWGLRIVCGNLGGAACE